MKDNIKLCDVCGKNEAHIHIVEVTPNGKRERNLCEECADKEGLMGNDDDMSFSFANFLKNIIPVAFEEAMENIENVCPNCGINYGEMKHRGKFGCVACYTAFREKIPEVLKIVQGKSESHIGKSPKSLKVITPQKELEKLKRSMKIAIEEEEYERAAEIRDRIKELERKVGKKRARS